MRSRVRPDQVQKLLAAFLSKGLSLKKVAEEIGITPQHLSRIKSGKKPLSMPIQRALEELAQRYGVTPPWLTPFESVLLEEAIPIFEDLESKKIIGYLSLPQRLRGDLAIVEVQSDDLSRRGIASGDYVIIDRKKSPEDGDIVFAKIGEEKILRYFHRLGSLIILDAGDPSVPLIGIQENKIVVLGVVVGVLQLRKPRYQP